MAERVTFQVQAADGAALLHASLEGPADAPVLTCLHTLATNSTLFDADVAALAGRHQVLRIDMRGHGLSTAGVAQDDADAAYTLEGLAADVVAVWDSLRIDRSCVLGLSIGGMIALELGLTYPERVDALIAAGCRADAPAPFREMWAARRETLAHGGLVAVADITLPSWLTSDASAAAVAHARRMIETTSIAGYAGATRALEKLAQLPRLAGISCPVLYLVGSNDGPHPAAQRAMAACTPGSQLVEIEGPAHLSNLEAPDAFVDAVLTFLETASQKVSI